MIARGVARPRSKALVATNHDLAWLVCTVAWRVAQVGATPVLQGKEVLSTNPDRGHSNLLDNDKHTLTGFAGFEDSVA